MPHPTPIARRGTPRRRGSAGVAALAAAAVLSVAGCSTTGDGHLESGSSKAADGSAEARAGQPAFDLTFSGKPALVLHKATGSCHLGRDGAGTIQSLGINATLGPASTLGQDTISIDALGDQPVKLVLDLQGDGYTLPVGTTGNVTWSEDRRTVTLDADLVQFPDFGDPVTPDTPVVGHVTGTATCAR